MLRDQSRKQSKVKSERVSRLTVDRTTFALAIYPKVFWVVLAAFFQASMSLAIYLLFYESQFVVIIDPWNSGES